MLKGVPYIDGLILLTEIFEDEVLILGCNHAERDLQELLNANTVYCRDNHGNLIELSLDMDFETPVALLVPG